VQQQAQALGGEAGVKALRFWQELVHERRVMRPPPGRDYNAWQAANQDFLAGRAAMVITNSAFLRYLERNASFPVTVAPVPRDVRAAAALAHIQGSHALCDLIARKTSRRGVLRRQFINRIKDRLNIALGMRWAKIRGGPGCNIVEIGLCGRR
jgi:hypothetical protein